MAGDVSSLIIALVFGALWVMCLWYRALRPQLDSPAATTTVQRLLKPRTPGDGPAGCHQPTLPPAAAAPPPSVRPWSELKSRRGAPKRFCCMRMGSIMITLKS